MSDKTLSPKSPQPQWSDEQELLQRLERQSRMARVGVLTPLVVTIIVLGLSLYFTWAARSSANVGDEAKGAVEAAAQSVPGVLKSGETSPADAIRQLSAALTARLPPSGGTTTAPNPVSSCLPPEVTNACGFDLDAREAVVFFSTDSIELSPTDAAVLRSAVRCLAPPRGVRVQVEGFADTRPSKRNDWLAEQRAKVTAELVRAQLGTQAANVVARGRGSAFPAALGTSPRLECQRVAVVKLER